MWKVIENYLTNGEKSFEIQKVSRLEASSNAIIPCCGMSIDGKLYHLGYYRQNDNKKFYAFVIA